MFKNRFNPGIALLILCILLSACGPSETESLSGETESLSGPKVIVFVWDGSYHGYHLDDVEIMLSMLEEAGILAVVTTESEDSYQLSDSSIKSDIWLQDVNVTDYDGFLLPCSAFYGDIGPGGTGDVVIPIVVEAASQNKPIAASHQSIQTLAEAGLLDGVSYSYAEKTGVIQDGNIITSGCCLGLSQNYGCEDGTHELTQKLIEAMTP